MLFRGKSDLHYTLYIINYTLSERGLGMSMFTKHAKVISGAAYFLLALPLFYFSHTVVLSLALAGIAGRSVYEALKVSGYAEAQALLWPGVLLALALPFQIYLPQGTVSALCFAYLMAALVIYLKGYDRFTLQQTIYCMFMTLLLSVGISVAAASRRIDLWALVLTFVGTWSTDVTAQYCGKLFGKHKLGIAVSPNKTIEGCVGSLLCTALVFGVFGAVLNRNFDYAISLPLIALLGVLVSAVGQVGDLLASAVKRAFGIKDFSNLIPGHGGMYDRFDSFVLTAPLLYLASAFSLFGS